MRRSLSNSPHEATPHDRLVPAAPAGRGVLAAQRGQSPVDLGLDERGIGPGGLRLNPPEAAVVLKASVRCGPRHPQLGSRLEREPQAVRLDQDRGADPRIDRTTSKTT